MSVVRAVVLGVLLCMCACRSGPRAGDGGGAVPSYEVVAAGYNARVAPLERIWCTTTLQVWYPNEQGEQDRAQVEGRLGYIRPHRVSLTMEKLGEMYGALGCNEREYWWLERNEERLARVGQMAKVSPERIAQLGLPVHPLDLVEAVGLSPLPETGGATRWSEDGKSVVVTTPGRMGERRMWVDPARFEPTRVELTGGGSETVMVADLASYQPVALPPGATASVRMATRITARSRVRDGELRVVLTLGEPEVRRDRPRDAVFELERLLAAYRISRVERLDD